MNNETHKLLVISILISSAIMSGCASTNAGSSLNMADASLLQDKDAQIETLNQRISTMESNVNDKNTAGATTANELLPPNAKPGECYARAFVPPTYKTESVRVLKKDASQRVESIPARYEWEETRVMVNDASERLEVVPATYEWVEEQVLTKPASKRIEVAPAVYKTVTEQILDKPEHTLWKKGSGPITKVDEGTGEIMCLVTVPATYKTVSKRVLVSDATTREIENPAEYQPVKKRVMKTPPTTRKVVIPAEYKMVKTRKLVEDSKTQAITIPAEYTDVTKREMVTDGRIEWRPVLCQTNTTPDVIRKLQTALDKAGFNPGPIDGQLGQGTLSAVSNYQKAKGLPTGGLTIHTLESLDVI